MSNLSLCMIVRNEEQQIGKCLASVQEAVDEMIIVDTGSTDQTMQICEALGASVYRFPWNGSFADARNYGLKFATGDWILWLDADEEVDGNDKHRLRNVLTEVSLSICNIHLINYYGEEVHPDKVLTVAHPRLFRNGRGFKFIGNIHEALNVLQLGVTEQEIGFVDVRVHHYGYMDPCVQSKKKVERNLKLLKQELLLSPENVPWLHYHLATEYMRSHQFQKAFEHTNRSILGFIQKAQQPPYLVYKLKYSILITTESWDGAWLSIELAIRMYPDYVDLWFYRGFILYNKGMYQEALHSFETCLELGENNLNYLILKGLGSFQAWHYKGKCLENLDRKDEALACFLYVLEQSPSFELSRKELDLITNQQEMVALIDTVFPEKDRNQKIKKQMGLNDSRSPVSKQRKPE